MDTEIIRLMRDAISKGDLNAAKQLSDDHPGLLRHLSESKRNWVHFAAEKGQAGVIRWLAKEGLDINARDDGGCSPLWCAIIIGTSLDAANSLLESGADAKPRSDENNLLTDMIIQQNFHQMSTSTVLALANVLMDYGCPVDDEDKWGSTPFCDAALYGLRSLAFLLLNRGANPRSKTNARGLDDAKERGQGELVQEVMVYIESLKAKDVIAKIEGMPVIRPLI